MNFSEPQSNRVETSVKTSKTETSEKIIRAFGFAVIFVFLAIIAIVLAFGLDKSFNYDPPNMVLILNILFLTGTGIAIAIISGMSYLSNGRLNILLFGIALFTGALASLLGGWQSNVSNNNSATIHNIGFLISSVVLFASVTTISSSTEISPQKRRNILIIAYSAVAIFFAGLTILTVNGLTPLFFTETGPTLIRQATLAATISLFTIGSLTFYWRYLQSKNETLLWCSMALGLFAISFLSLSLQHVAGDPFGWVGRIAQYIGGFFFLSALLRLRTQTPAEAGISEKWAEAFRSDRAQVTALLRLMLDAFIYCKIVIDNEGRPIDWIYLDVNEAHAQMLGLTKDQIIGKRVSEVIPEEIKDQTDWIGKYGRVALTGESLHFEGYRQSLKKWVHTSAYSPKKGYFVAIFEDITERKKAEENLKGNEQTFLELIERSPFGIYVVNSQFHIQYMNKGSQDAAFRNVRPVIGRDFSEAMHILWPEPTASEIIAHFRHTLQTGDPYYSPPFVYPRHDVEIVEAYEWELQRIRLPTGQYGVICYYFDSTKLRETERGLSQAQAQLKEYATNLERLVEERTKQLKDAERLAAIGATAGMVGHDIRNPLQAIVSDVFLIKFDMSAIPDIEQKEGIQESLDSIEKNISYINKIVQDLQDFAKVLNPVAKEVDLSILCENILKSSNVPTNIEATCKVEKNANAVMADEELLRRVVGNLAINAVQAMPDGGKLDIYAYRQEKDIIIEVKDTGMGIPEEVKPRLFTPLFTTKSKGQGFGLAVVKRVTESMNGTITFESQEGKGTKFILRFSPPRKINGEYAFEKQ